MELVHRAPKILPLLFSVEFLSQVPSPEQLPLQIRVYEISGPLFFGAADVIEHIAVKD